MEVTPRAIRGRAKNWRVSPTVSGLRCSLGWMNESSLSPKVEQNMMAKSTGVAVQS